jgi:hypothetical protein
VCVRYSVRTSHQGLELERLTVEGTGGTRGTKRGEK